MHGIARVVAPAAGFRFVCYCRDCQAFMDHPADGRSRDEALGPPLCRIFELSATAPFPLNAPAPPSLGLFALCASRVLGWWWRGLGRPHPFFDAQTNAPLSMPRWLTPSERVALLDGAG